MIQEKDFYYIIPLIWTFDLLSTFIALEFCEGFYETNFLAALCFEMGLIGYLVFAISAYGIIFLFNNLIYSIYMKFYQDEREKLGRFLVFFYVISLVLLELYCIVNNLILILTRCTI